MYFNRYLCSTYLFLHNTIFISDGYYNSFPFYKFFKHMVLNRTNMVKKEIHKNSLDEQGI